MNRVTKFSFFVLTAISLGMMLTQAAPVRLFDQKAVTISHPTEDIILVDFGRVAYGNIRFSPRTDTKNEITLHFGEAFVDGRIDRTPPGTVRYATSTLSLRGKRPTTAYPSPDFKNTQQNRIGIPPAVLTPYEWGVVLPFRWLEIEGWSGKLHPDEITRQAAFSSTWDDNAAAFESSDEMLNQIWELCRYSIKATSFAGIYVDGERERIPYEADSYLNQLSHYATDYDVQIARDTFDRMMIHPTWPTEWAPHMIFMAHADWMHTGQIDWIASRFDALKSKLLLERAGPDGLITSSEKDIKRTDIVDWPRSERDDYVFTSTNTVVNAFHLQALSQMADMAEALDRKDEATAYRTRAEATRNIFQEKLFNTETGLFRDGIETEHSSLHANLFPLAFDLVPETHRKHIAQWLADRGMACSVYAAQYLMEGLLQNGADTKALELITAHNDRSWRHMVESGTTITWEAWDQKYKPNQDWNHAWGAAPANLLPRFVIGAQAMTPGWETALIRPNLGDLSYAKGQVPTPRGPISVNWKNEKPFSITINLPEGMNAQVELPASPKSKGIYLGDKLLDAKKVGTRWVINLESAQATTLEVR